VAMVGGTTTGTTLAMMPLFEEVEIPFISLAGAVQIIEPVRKWVFKTPHTDRMACEKIFADAKKRGLTTVALIWGTGAFGKSMREQCVAAASRSGITIAHEESYSPRDSDITPQLTNIRGKAGIAAVINADFGQGPAIVTRNYRQVGMQLPFYQSHGVASKQFIELAGPAANGVRLPASALLVADKLPDGDPQKPVVAFSGLTAGAVYALVALGFTLIFNSCGVINFAQGEFVMLGGMITVFLSLAGLPLPLAACLAIVAVVLVGFGIHVFAIDRARDATTVALIVITIGASIFLRGAAQVLFDKRFHTLPSWFGDNPIVVGGAAILPQSLAVLGVAAVIVVLLWALIDRTLLGKAIVATASNQLAASLAGINTRLMVGLSFAISAAIGAAAGIVITPIMFTSYDIGTLLALKGFAAAMLGGIGHPVGAVVSGIVLGLSEAFSAGYFSSQYKDAVALVLLLAVLFACPQGLLGRPSPERV
jgi:branched-chain amino acid transport system permease protein